MMNRTQITLKTYHVYEVRFGCLNVMTPFMRLEDAKKFADRVAPSVIFEVWDGEEQYHPY